MEIAGLVITGISLIVDILLLVKVEKIIKIYVGDVSRDSQSLKQVVHGKANDTKAQMSK